MNDLEKKIKQKNIARIRAQQKKIKEQEEELKKQHDAYPKGTISTDNSNDEHNL